MNRYLSQIQPAAKWVAILLLMAVVVGTASAFFLWTLDAVTRVRFENPWLLYFLPVGGFLMGWLYLRHGKNGDDGTHLILAEIHETGVGVPRRLAPLVLIGTLVTHLFGGSAGREGTAVQMGGGIAAGFARFFRLDAAGVRLLLMAGIAAGFGSVFGTPIAGAVFALEVLKSEKLEWGAMLPCLTAAVVANWTCAGWGIHHTHYQMTLAGFHLEPWLLGKVILAAVIFGWVGAAFTRSYRWLRHQFAQRILRPELRPVAGGVIVIGLFFLAGGDYLGLGVLGNGADAVTLPAMFHSSEIPASAWIWKFIFTVVTLSAGFKGGEVTPLFFIGAALGNAFAQVLGAPLDLFAAIGFVALFAAASKTPIASTLLGMELFGIGNGFYLAAACLVAYRFSGQSGIYTAHGLAATRSSQISH